MKQKEIKDSKAKKQPLEDEQTKKVTGGIGGFTGDGDSKLLL